MFFKFLLKLIFWMKEYNLISSDFDVLFDRLCFVNEIDMIFFVSFCLFLFLLMYNIVYFVCKVCIIVISFLIILEDI